MRRNRRDDIGEDYRKGITKERAAMESEEGLATSAAEMSTAEIATEKRTGNTSDQLPIICLKCGTENDPGMKFCGNCGTELGDNAAQPAPAKGLQKPQSSKSKKSKKGLVIAIVIAVVAVAAITATLFMTVLSPQAKADRLYEEGSYVEAMEIYQTLDRSDEIDAKMSDCRYNLFVSHLVTDGPYKTTEGYVTWTVEGYANGDIKCSLQEKYNGGVTAGNEMSYIITIHHGSTTADFSASEKIKILSQSMNESGSGKLDLPSYSYGKDITLDSYSNTGTTAGASMIKSNGSVVSKMIQKGLKGAISARAAGATLADLGFTNLS